MNSIPNYLKRVIDSKGQELPNLSSLTRQAPPSYLYHYTSVTGIVGILEQKEIWATEIHFFDDKSEIVYFKRQIDVWADLLANNSSIVANRIESDFLVKLGHRVLHERRPGVCVASFSTDDNSLSLWRQYGNATESYCIGLSGNSLEQAADSQDCILGSCNYDEDLSSEIVQEILVSLLVQFRVSGYDEDEKCRLQDELSNMVLQYGPFLKRPSFDVEKEWRIVTKQRVYDLEVREVKGRLRPFYRFDITGPISAKGAANEARILSQPDGSEDLPGYAIQLLSKRILGRNIWYGVYVD